MAAKTKASQNGHAVIDFATLSPATRRYERFTMDHDEGEGDGEPLEVRVLRMTVGEQDAIPADNTPMKDIIRDNRRYIVGWNVRAMSDTGEIIDVMPPAEMDEESAEIAIARLLTSDQVRWVYQVLKFGHSVKLLYEKKALSTSDTSPASSPEGN